MNGPIVGIYVTGAGSVPTHRTVLCAMCYANYLSTVFFFIFPVILSNQSLSETTDLLLYRHMDIDFLAYADRLLFLNIIDHKVVF